MNLFFLYLLFFKTGLFAVGGGLATLPFLFQMADNYEWLDKDMIGNILAIAQASPGPIGVNMAAQTGFMASGIAGSFVAVLGLISPAIIIIAIISMLFKSFKENKIVISVFSGMRPAATGLLAAAGFGIFKLSLFNENGTSFFELFYLKEFAIFAVLLLIIFRFKGHPIIYISIGAAAGILLKL